VGFRGAAEECAWAEEERRTEGFRNCVGLRTVWTARVGWRVLDGERGGFKGEACKWRDKSQHACVHLE